MFCKYFIYISIKNGFHTLGTSAEPAKLMYILKRLEAYLIPVLWLLTDPKVFLFLKTKLMKVIRVYNFS